MKIKSSSVLFSSLQVTYLIGGRLEIEERFANQHAPAALRMTVLNLDDPAFKSGLLILSTQKDSGRVPSNSVLQDADPFFDGATRIGRQVVRLLGSGNLKSGRSFCPPHSTSVVERDLSLSFAPTSIALRFPVGKGSILEDKPALPPCFKFPTEFREISTLFKLLTVSL